MLWLALSLPQLPLEALASRPDATLPAAIVWHDRIVVGNEAATAAGIVAGLKLAAAWARLPALAIHERNPAAEASALQRLACWAGEYTSEISLRPPQTLLLEIGASLRLFGGAEALYARIVSACAGQGFQSQTAIAPTPLAAEWLASAANGALCLDGKTLPALLAPLPLQVLALSPAEEARLASFGARTLGDVLRLPRAGLAKRFGAGFATRLAQALGELPDPRPRFVFPQRFAERLELPAPVEHAPALLFAARRLIAALCGWLATRQSGVLHCRLELEHQRGHPATPLDLAFAAATRDGERMLRILGERLHSLQLNSATSALRLLADSPQPLPGRDAALFADGHGNPAQESLAALVERLQARLGADGIHALCRVDEHRPELASRPMAPWSAAPRTPAAAHGPRPLWLLPQPQALRERDGQPQHGGPLRLLVGPERIESGWWDAGEPGATGDLRRDYFIALSPHAEWLWVFRSAEGWFLHGLFA